jgi:hypothetical protein
MHTSKDPALLPHLLIEVMLNFEHRNSYGYPSGCWIFYCYSETGNFLYMCAFRTDKWSSNAHNWTQSLSNSQRLAILRTQSVEKHTFQYNTFLMKQWLQSHSWVYRSVKNERRNYPFYSDQRLIYHSLKVHLDVFQDRYYKILVCNFSASFSLALT